MPTQKKTYSHLRDSPFSSHFKPSLTSQESKKKIIPTAAHSGLREDYKKIFLPLLIDIFELRQMIDTYKVQQQSPKLRYFGKVSKTPQEILLQLQHMQLDIEESQRWCEGVILQISKGIQEAKEALELLSPSSSKESSSSALMLSLKTLFSTIKGWVWKLKQRL
jgi:hypothetical protein